MKMNNIRVVSTGKYLPERIITNADLEKIVDTSNDWIYTHTGIKERRKVTDETTSDMAAKAALAALYKAHYNRNLIDLIIVASFTPDQSTPSIASYVQTKLGLNDKEITCFDLNAACSGFIYALNVATQMLNSGRYHSALVIGADRLTKVVDYKDRNSCILFGDGAGAILIENTSYEKPAFFYTAGKGDLEQTMVVDPLIKMDGSKMADLAKRVLEKSINLVLKETNLTIDNIEKIIPSQTNARIIESACESLGIDMDKVFMNIEKYGNTSSASIPIALDEYLETLSDHDDKKLMLVGFGAGFTWGAALLTL